MDGLQDTGATTTLADRRTNSSQTGCRRVAPRVGALTGGLARAKALELGLSDPSVSTILVVSLNASSIFRQHARHACSRPWPTD